MSTPVHEVPRAGSLPALSSALDDINGNLNAVVSQILTTICLHDHINGIARDGMICRPCRDLAVVMDAHHHAAAALRGLRKVLTALMAGEGADAVPADWPRA